MDLGYADYFQFVLALVFVLALIAVLAVLARRFGFGYRTPARGKRERRLSVVEIMPLDPKRRVALIRRDDVEHLVLLGTGSELLIESNIPAPKEDFGAALADVAAALPDNTGPGGTGKTE